MPFWRDLTCVTRSEMPEYSTVEGSEEPNVLSTAEANYSILVKKTSRSSVY